MKPRACSSAWRRSLGVGSGIIQYGICCRSSQQGRHVIPFEIIVTFIGAATLLAWVPGPDNLFVLTQSALHGSKIGIFVTLGLCTGLIVHSVAVSLGVAAIFQTSQLAFTALKVIGAGYLLYLAYRAFR